MFGALRSFRCGLVPSAQSVKARTAPVARVGVTVGQRAVGQHAGTQAPASAPGVLHRFITSLSSTIAPVKGSSSATVINPSNMTFERTYKLKSHSGAKKRFHVNGAGKVKYYPNGRRHLLACKPRKRLRRLGQAGYLENGQEKAAHALLRGG